MFIIRGYEQIGLHGVINIVLSKCNTEVEAKQELVKYQNSKTIYNVHYYFE